MWEAMEGAILLVGGGWLWLIAFGRVRLSRDPERVMAFRRKYGVVLSVVGVLVMATGLYQLIQFVLSAPPA